MRFTGVGRENTLASDPMSNTITQMKQSLVKQNSQKHISEKADVLFEQPQRDEASSLSIRSKHKKNVLDKNYSLPGASRLAEANEKRKNQNSHEHFNIINNRKSSSFRSQSIRRSGSIASNLSENFQKLNKQHLYPPTQRESLGKVENLELQDDSPAKVSTGRFNSNKLLNHDDENNRLSSHSINSS